jgi:hypothetical protein
MALGAPYFCIVSFAEPWEHAFPAPHKDVLMNCVSYRISPEIIGDLARFDGSIIAFRTPGELAARCDKEGLNFLALNLAHEIATGKRSVEEARQFLGQEAMNFKQGKTSTYTQGLMFEPEANTGDPDQPAAGGIPPSTRDPAMRDPSMQPGREQPGRPEGTPPRSPGNEPRPPSNPR